MFSSKQCNYLTAKFSLFTCSCNYHSCSEANTSCVISETEYIFLKHDLPKTVDLVCSLPPNQTIGEWMWEDEDGEMITKLPQCAVISFGYKINKKPH